MDIEKVTRGYDYYEQPFLVFLFEYTPVGRGKRSRLVARFNNKNYFVNDNRCVGGLAVARLVSETVNYGRISCHNAMAKIPETLPADLVDRTWCICSLVEYPASYQRNFSYGQVLQNVEDATEVLYEVEGGIYDKIPTNMAAMPLKADDGGLVYYNP